MQSTYWHPDTHSEYPQYPDPVFPSYPHSPDSTLNTPTSAYDDQRYPSQNYSYPRAEYTLPKHPASVASTSYYYDFPGPSQPELSPITPTHQQPQPHSYPVSDPCELYGDNFLLQDEPPAPPSAPAPPAMVGEQLTNEGIQDSHAFDSFNLLGQRRAARSGSRGGVNTNPNASGARTEEQTREDNAEGSGSSSGSGSAPSSSASERTSSPPTPANPSTSPSSRRPRQIQSAIWPSPPPGSYGPQVPPPPPPPTSAVPPALAHPLPQRSLLLQAQQQVHHQQQQPKITIPNGYSVPSQHPHPHTHGVLLGRRPSTHIVGPAAQMGRQGPRGNYNGYPYPSPPSLSPTSIYAGGSASIVSAGYSHHPHHPSHSHPSQHQRQHVHQHPHSHRAQFSASVSPVSSRHPTLHPHPHTNASPTSTSPTHAPPFQHHQAHAHQTHAQHQSPQRPSTPEHVLTETHSIPSEELDRYFRPAELESVALANDYEVPVPPGPGGVNSGGLRGSGAGVGGNGGAGGASGRKTWVCPECKKHVRKQDRASHKLSHEGKKRYDCRCGKKFGRPQDADRHIREQAPCRACGGKMGRYGKDGKCSTFWGSRPSVRAVIPASAPGFNAGCRVVTLLSCFDMLVVCCRRCRCYLSCLSSSLPASSPPCPASPQVVHIKMAPDPPSTLSPSFDSYPPHTPFRLPSLLAHRLIVKTPDPSHHRLSFIVHR
ncbi:hypothetical protein M422DRAFT_260473 [Sphaerobolus stellatus SS14]|uniref:C2H2-type domain-containing protein n=1 Tax=Sphaerobolus stellatus (strain SS14) TaxID=990650 RepID=A0A0C9UQR4_SPHS4|nr:hypothetical protein M422DRAFT_260473 [Sphaerobolus stellatus SS14]